MAHDLRKQMASERDALVGEGKALAAELRALDLRGHETHGLRPWRTCRSCWRMSVFVFIEIPLHQRWWEFRHWLRPVIVRASRQNFVTREWRWTRLAISQRELWVLARQRCPRGPWVHPSIYPLFYAWDVHGGRLPNWYET